MEMETEMQGEMEMELEMVLRQLQGIYVIRVFVL